MLSEHTWHMINQDVHVGCHYDSVHVSWTTSRHLDHLLTPTENLYENTQKSKVLTLFYKRQVKLR